MQRLLICCGKLQLYSYPAMLYLGLVAGVLVGNLAAHAAHVDAFAVFVATLILIPPSIVGARLLYVAMNWNRYRKSPSRIWDRSNGGLEMFGGMPVMLLLSLPVLHFLRLSLAAFWDVAGLTIMTGLTITKIGCFLNGCCAGRAWSGRFAFLLPGARGNERRIPVQLLEAGWGAVLLICASPLIGHMPFRGGVFLVVVAVYSSGRLFFETIREQETPSAPWTAGRAASCVSIAASLTILILRWPK